MIRDLIAGTNHVTRSTIACDFADLTDALRRIVGPEAVLSSHGEMLVYECDGFTIEKNSPDVVVFPRTTADVQQIVRLCNKYHVPFLPRGAGTSLAGAHRVLRHACRRPRGVLPRRSRRAAQRVAAYQRRT